MQSQPNVPVSTKQAAFCIFLLVEKKLNRLANIYAGLACRRQQVSINVSLAEATAAAAVSVD